MCVCDRFGVAFFLFFFLPPIIFFFHVILNSPCVAVVVVYGQPHTVFGEFISISGLWMLLCKEFIVDEKIVPA